MILLFNTVSLIKRAAEEVAPAATILDKGTEELMSVYAEYTILGIDVVTGIVIAISTAMAIIGFFRIITKTTHPQANNRQRNNQA